MRRAGRAGRAGDQGAAAVEFALISVALFTLMFGILQYGFYFFQATAIEAAAREAARRASVGIETCVAWGEQVVDVLPGAARGSISSISSTGASARGQDLTVTIVWEPVSFRLVPVPDPAPETAVTRVERLGSETGGCRIDYAP